MPPSEIELSQSGVSPGSLDVTIVCRIRLVLALSAPIAIFIDPSEHFGYPVLARATLIAYVIYSLVLCLVMPEKGERAPGRLINGIDIVWYTVLVSLSGGSNSPFFFLYAFSILVASMRWGFSAGIQTSVASAVLFALGSYWFTPPSDFRLSRLLLRPIFLIALGYLTAFWGGREIRHKRRLALLEKITSLANSKLSVDYTIRSILDNIRAFYEADKCLLVTCDQNRNEFYLHRVARDAPRDMSAGPEISADEARYLLPLPDDCAAVYYASNGITRFWPWAQHSSFFNGHKDMLAGDEHRALESLAALLDGDSFVTLPFTYHDEIRARVYLVAPRRTFGKTDIQFLHNIFARVAPNLENIRLLARLASDAATRERQRLARDIHDSVIQPFIAVQLGLDAIEIKLATRPSEVGSDLQRLKEMARSEVASIRALTARLREGTEATGILMSAMRRLAEGFSDSSGIEVKLDIDQDLRLNDRLSAEIFQIVSEGLSNIRRHTHAKNAVITLKRNGEFVTARVENDDSDTAPWAPFIPRSITERTRALDGSIRVEKRDGGGSRLELKIPLTPQLV